MPKAFAVRPICLEDTDANKAITARTLGYLAMATEPVGDACYDLRGKAELARSQPDAERLKAAFEAAYPGVSFEITETENHMSFISCLAYCDSASDRPQRF